MKKHYLDAPKDIKQEDVKHLPDRNDLSKLYPIPTKSAPVRDDGEHQPPFSLIFSLLSGVCLTAPFILAVFLFMFFSQSIRASNILFFLPLIVLSILLIVILLVMVYKNVSKKILAKGYDALAILALHAACLMCLIPPLYLLFSSLVLLYSIAVSLVSAVLMRIFLKVASNSRGDASKNIVLLGVCGISFFISVFYLLNR